MFHYIVGASLSVAALYVLIRLLLPAHLPWWAKGVGIVLVMACALRLPLLQAFGGSIMQDIKPVPLHLFASFLTLTVLLLFVLALGRDIFLVGARIFRQNPVWLTSGRTGLVLAIVAGVLAIHSIWEAVRVPAVTRIAVSIPALPPALDGFTIAHLTDLHIGPLLDKAWAQEVVNRTNALRPDVIAITGDVVDGSVAVLSPEVAPLRGLYAPHGVFLTVGNHEYYSGYLPWVQSFRSMGIRVLLNEHEVVRVPAKSGAVQVADHGRAAQETGALTIAGITDDAARGRYEPPNLAKALEGAPEDAPCVLLSHRPYAAYAAARSNRVDVQLSGHTHGGTALPLAPIVARFNGGFVRGMYKIKNLWLYVHPGTGLWGGFPMRLFNPPAITLIELHASAGT